MSEDVGQAPSAAAAAMGQVLLDAAGIGDSVEPDEKAAGADIAPAAAGDGEGSVSAELGALLAGMAGGGETAPPAGEGGDAGEGSGDGASDSLTLENLAEKLGVNTAELYDVAIPMPDGQETVKLSDLKDMATKYTRQDGERLEWETETGRQRQELATGRMELQHMLEMVPQQFRTAEMLGQAKRSLSKIRQDEARMLLDRVPEWKDPKVFESDQRLIIDHLAPFGFTKEDWGTVVDHRLQAYARQNARFMQRVNDIAGKSKASRTTKAASKTGGGTSTGTQQTSQAAGGRKGKRTELGKVLLEGMR